MWLSYAQCYAGGGFVSFGMLSLARATDRVARGRQAMRDGQELLQRQPVRGGHQVHHLLDLLRYPQVGPD